MSRQKRRPALTKQQITKTLEVVAQVNERRFSLANKPEDPSPRFSIVGKGVCTPGNLTAVISQAKGGKSSFIASKISARICADLGKAADTLGISASKGDGVLILIDTEQSRADHYGLIERSLRRAGVTEAPIWLESFALAGYSASELQTSLRALLWEHAHSGIFAVILDGIADFVTDVNDAAECNAFVAELHALAIRYDTSIICILHENPTQDSGKARGHLGSQLERKAESNLRIKKVDGVSVVYSERMRKAPILESEGPRFQWSDEAGMHVSIEPGDDPKTKAKRAELQDLAAEVYSVSKRMTWKDLISAVKNARGCSQATAERKVKDLQANGIIRTDSMGMKERVL